MEIDAGGTLRLLPPYSIITTYNAPEHSAGVLSRPANMTGLNHKDKKVKKVKKGLI